MAYRVSDASLTYPFDFKFAARDWQYEYLVDNPREQGQPSGHMTLITSRLRLFAAKETLRGN